MQKFIGRQRDLDELNSVIAQPGAQFLLVYGRRRVGKTTLILHWAQQTKQPVIYWVAARDTPAQVRSNFTKAVWQWAYPGTQAIPNFKSWTDIFEAVADLIGDQPLILIMDEFSYAVESDPSLPSYLQAAWDHHFKKRNLTIVLAGSHIGMMVDLMNYQAPLYGRFTAQLPVDLLPFSTLQEFLPHYSIAERVAVYAVTGGVPAYLERFNDAENVGANLQRLFMRRTSMFHSEPFMLVGDVIRRETQTYEAILKAIANGSRTPQEIGKVIEKSSSYLSPYLQHLTKLRIIKRHIPATIPPEKRNKSRNSRYHLADPYLRFYFRFIAPNFELVEQELTDVLWQRISSQFRAFVGLTAFEDLCREWALIQARAGQLPFPVELVGSHWSKNAQIDVVAINWHEKAILLGECKWGINPVGRAVIRELIDKTPLVLPDTDWEVHYVFFGRSGFTDPAKEEAAGVGARLVDLTQLDFGLN